LAELGEHKGDIELFALVW